uniref:Putative chloride channel n=1 Tax=Amblyomma triste TaxID=251400 RepID=A0A023G3E5_AMBTT
MKLFVPKLLGSLLLIASLCHLHGANSEQWPETECGSSGENEDCNHLNESVKADYGSASDTESFANPSLDWHELNPTDTLEEGAKTSEDVFTLTANEGMSDLSASASQLPTPDSVPAATANDDTFLPPPSGAGTYTTPPAVDGAGYLNGIPGGTSTIKTGGKHESSGFGSLGKMAVAGAAGLAIGAIGSRLLSSKSKRPTTTVIHKHVYYGPHHPGEGSLQTPSYSTSLSGSSDLGNLPKALPGTSNPGTPSYSNINPGNPSSSPVSTPPTSPKRFAPPKRPSFPPPNPPNLPTNTRPPSPSRFPRATASWIPLDQSSSTGLRPMKRQANSRFQKG